jgi:hypothetical protein
MQIRRIAATFTALSCLAGACAFAQGTGGTTTGTKPHQPATTGGKAPAHSNATRKPLPARNAKGQFVKSASAKHSRKKGAMSGKNGAMSGKGGAMGSKSGGTGTAKP